MWLGTLLVLCIQSQRLSRKACKHDLVCSIYEVYKDKLGWLNLPSLLLSFPLLPLPPGSGPGLPIVYRDQKWFSDMGRKDLPSLSPSPPSLHSLRSEAGISHWEPSNQTAPLRRTGCGVRCVVLLPSIGSHHRLFHQPSWKRESRLGKHSDLWPLNKWSDGDPVLPLVFEPLFSV